MANKYPRSSYNDQAIIDSATAARHLLQGGVTTGRVFWLRGMKVSNPGIASVLNLFDSTTEGAAPAADLQRLQVTIAATSTNQFDFGYPGIKFVTGIIAGETAALATLQAYGISVWGYEE